MNIEAMEQDVAEPIEDLVARATASVELESRKVTEFNVTFHQNNQEIHRHDRSRFAHKSGMFLNADRFEMSVVGPDRVWVRVREPVTDAPLSRGSIEHALMLSGDILVLEPGNLKIDFDEDR